MRNDVDAKKDWIEQQLLLDRSRLDICRELKCKYDTLKQRLDKWGLSHLKNPSRKGIPRPDMRSDVQLYLNNSKTITSSKLKHLLYREGLKSNKCDVCGIEDWNNKPLMMELDHLDGNHYNNSFENLSIKCPNCHAQSPNNSGKNIGRYV